MKNSLLSLCLFALLTMTAPSAAQEPEPCDSCAGYPAGSYMRSGGPELGGAVYHLSCQSDVWEEINGAACTEDCLLDGETVAHGASFTFYSVEESADCAGNSQSRTCTDGTLDGNAGFQYANCSAPVPDPCEGSPTLGTECSDGSFYIGLSPEDGAKVYMTSAAYETSSRWDEDPPCYRCGDYDTGATSITDGRANVEALRAYGGDNATAGNLDGFGAAKYCDNLVGVHGHSDWYLPAGTGTGTGSEQSLLWVMVQSEGIVDGIGSNSLRYWSSSEGHPSRALTQRFTNGALDYELKSGFFQVRCVRR